MKEKGEDIEVINAYLKEGRVDKAIELAKKMVDKNPEDEKIRALLGLAYIRKGQYEVGIAECREALKINPNYVEAYVTLGKGALRKSDYEEAIEALKKALELEPNNRDARYQLGLAYDHLGIPGKAKEEYRKVYQQEALSPEKKSEKEIKAKKPKKGGG